MTNLYLWLKAIHVLAVTIWLGAAMTIFAVTGLMTRTTERHRLAAFARVCDFTGLRLIAPAGGIAFLAGIAATIAGHVPMQLWVWWGILAALLVLSIGGAMLGRGFRRLCGLLDVQAPDEAAAMALLGRLRGVATALIVVLAVTVIVMVLKPV